MKDTLKNSSHVVWVSDFNLIMHTSRFDSYDYALARLVTEGKIYDGLC